MRKAKGVEVRSRLFMASSTHRFATKFHIGPAVKGRLARSPLNFGPPLIWSHTFEEPGLYLVICDVLPHFVDAKMYAGIRVS